MTAKITVARFRDFGAKLAGSLYSGVGRVLPMRARVSAKEATILTSKMDFQGVRIVTDSTIEYSVRRRSCKKEPETIHWIKNFIRPGDVVFDIGANIGAYSLVIHKVYGPTVSVLAFEPSFSNFSRLCRNVSLNGAKTIRPFPIGLSDVTELTPFHYSDIRPGAARHGFGKSVDQNGKCFDSALEMPVLSFRMDEFVEKFKMPTPNHIKLDVDGPELAVLRGAGTLLNQVKTILVELDPSMPSSGMITEFLQSAGFTLNKVGNRGGTQILANSLFTR